MSGLPPGWEWDYDGARWFYRYKPNGHVQFHFPKEGDEFPDFVDALSPAPELAPEEKLESQQQLKRRTTTDADPQTKMHATGGPLADFGMNRSGFGGPLNDDDAEGFCYQPENFMYLGPGAYTDISPPADEDEGGGIPNDRHPSKSNAAPELVKDKAKLDADVDRAGVSPLHSQANTPFVANSVPAEQPTSSGSPEPVVFVNTQDLPESNQAAVPSPGVPLLDSVEKPRAVALQTPWDPVGIVAEMATEHTAAAHIETNPDPVEMADNAVLAPIETRVVDVGIAELPERTSPADARPLAASDHDLLHQTSMTGAALQGATFGTGQRPQSASPDRTASGSSHPAVNGSQVDNSLPEPVRAQQQPTSHPSNGPFTIKRKPSNPGTKQPKYQPYIPGVTPLVAPTRADRGADFKRQDNRTSLAREASLMLGTRQKLETENVPSILQPPQVPPKHPLDATQAAPVESYGPSQPPGNPAVQGLVDAAQSPSSGRRQSLPMNPDLETGGTLSSRNEQQLPDTARRIERPQSAQPLQSIPANYPGQLPPPGASDLASTQPPDAGRHVKQASERPQRPTVTPPGQFFGPMTPSTPVKTPGHQLQPIQEHTEGAVHNMLPSVVARNSQDARRQSPATSRRLSTGSSQYPSSADSSSGRTLGSSTSAHFMSPAAPTAGQTYSPVQQNPYYQQSPTGAVAQASPLTMRPGTTPPVTQRQAKEKEKGGWLSRIVKGPGKPAVLRKPPPPAHAFHAAPQPQQPFGGDQERFSASSSGWRPTSQAQHGQVVPNEHVHQQARPDAGRLPENPPPARLVESTPHAMEQTLVPKQSQTASAPVEQATPRFNLQDAPVQNLVAEVRPASLPPSGLTAGLGAQGDDMSDAASVSAISVSTVDVSEAQAQPVLKPQLITLEKPPVSAKEQLPSRAMMSTSAGVEKLPVTTTQREVNRRPALGSELAVAPLFSEHQIKTTVFAVAVTEAPVTSDKWAKKPAVDYSGDDWGDDPWDYQ
ncbi:hypothetical protein Cob_v007650 [Colletotrichum orbiculare MAFF 240422]|uniref:Uncharacterized protein n=1 Tax=Colletotrichum orbiculare (strain 104-T / ATCC 96160 / CBS 514.97 / LARS 414 / MAFF 240422) TaxID=1213857 RepID=A0A484FPA6_COLOR|nr:hypothetical protein Cob_v007650 [Colletotrichum orbiculare MAFF 240422]